MISRTEQSRALLMSVHALFCHKSHDGHCNFYEEIELADCWEEEDVVTWSALTGLILKNLGIGESELLKALDSVSAQLMQVAMLTPVERQLFDAITRGADLSFLILVGPHAYATGLLTTTVEDLDE